MYLYVIITVHKKLFDYYERNRDMTHKKLYFNIISFVLCLSMLLPLCACSKDEPVQKQVFAMDTIMTLTAYGKAADAGLDAAVGVIQAMDTMLDPNSESSYTGLINNAQGNNVIVPPQVAEMLSVASDIYNKTNGALDLSVYPIYEAWGEFKEDTGRIPSSDEITELLTKLKFDQLRITKFPGESNSSISLPAGTEISFGAIAKGCASNYAIDAMKKAGIESGLVSLGGNVQTLGVKPDGSNWVIAVDDPDNTGSYIGTLSVGETAVVTSGNYQRYFTIDGKNYHHLIDPHTGRPANNGLKSVTIICPDGTTADALSTAMFVLGEKRALDYWRDNGGFEMIMINEDNNVICTSGLIEVFTLTNTTDYTYTMME